jgi:hypothetical protein
MTLLKQGVYGTYLFFNKEKRQEKSDLASSNPDLPRIISLWNILENKYVQKTFENVPLIMPNIRVNKKIGIPMLDRPVMGRANIKSEKIKSEEQKLKDFEIVENDELKLTTENLDRTTHV